MLKHKLLLGTAAVLATVAIAGTAEANITLEGFNVSNTVAGDAIPANVPAPPADYIATAPNSTTFTVGDSSVNTVNDWITSGGGMVTVGNGSHTMNDTLWNIVGTVTVTSGEKFTFRHDDGLTLIIDGITVVSAPGPTSAVTTTGTYTGPSGNRSFQLVYGECCSGPATLNVNLPFTSGVPEPSTWALMGFGFAGLGFAAFHRGRKRAVSIA